MRHIKTSKGRIVFNIFNITLLSLFSFICIYPFYYVVIYSISNAANNLTNMTFLPAGFSLTTFVGILRSKDVTVAIGVSALRTVLGTIITLICCTFFAYIVSKKEMFLRKFVYRFLILTMYFNAGLIPWYLTMRAYGLKNNFLLYIVPSALSAFFVILIKTYIDQLPPSLEESAKIDGAGYLRIFVSIIVPLSGPIIATIAVYASVAQWNSWQDNYFLMNSSPFQTLQLTLYNYLNQAQQFSHMTSEEMGKLTQGNRNIITPDSIKMAITVITILPIIFVYPFFQKYFVKGIMLGAVKG